MKNKKIIIMSVDGHKTVGYTDDGEFVNLPKKENHQVGQIISISSKNSNKRNFLTGWQMAATAAAIMLVAVMGVLYPQFTPEAEAYLSLGLNSGGVEMWVDGNDNVIDVEYHDEAATWKELDLKGKNVYQAVTMLASKAQQSGLLDKQQNKIFMLNQATLKQNMPHHFNESKLKQSATKGLSSNYNGLMIMGNHDMNFINKAKASGVTASQYYVIEKSNNTGHHLTADQIRGHHISDVLNENGTTVEEVFSMKPHMGQNNSSMPMNNDDYNHSKTKDNNGYSMPHQNNMNDMQQTIKPSTNTHQQMDMYNDQYMNNDSSTPSQDSMNNMQGTMKPSTNDHQQTEMYNNQYMNNNSKMHQRN